MEADFQPKLVWDWLRACPAIKDMYFALGRAEPNAVTLLPITAHKDRTVARFIDGSEIRQCDFALVKFEPLDELPNDAGNMDAQENFEAIAKWIDAKGAAGEFPQLSPGRRAQKLMSLPTEVGFIAGVGGGTARFMMQFRIEYYCEE